MKKTLQEEKDRILEISRKLNENLYADDYGAKRDLHQLQQDEIGDMFIKEGEPLNMAILNFMSALQSKGVPNNVIFQELRNIVENHIEVETDSQNEDNTEEEPHDPSTLNYRDTGGTEGG